MFCQSQAPNGASAGMQKHDEPVDWGRVVHKKKEVACRSSYVVGHDQDRLVPEPVPAEGRGEIARGLPCVPNTRS